MSDIFISYKREEQAIARKLADALESEGWTVWWDPMLRAGERFNDVIEKALKESKCVVVMWSKRSVESQYVKHEANYALRRNKLVPVMIEEVELPFRFEDLHTLSLLDWDGSRDFSEFRKLVNDISTILGLSRATTPEEQHRQGEAQRKAEEAHLPEQEREEEARRKANEDERIWRRWVEQQETEHTRLEADVNRKGEDKQLREREKQRAEEEAERKADEDKRKRIEKLHPTERLKAGTVFFDRLNDGSKGPEMVVIPAGMFRMGDFHGDGDKSERPGHTVRLRKPFAMGRYEVTFEEYGQFATVMARKLPYDKNWGRGQRPVIYVSWQDAVDYAKWLVAQTGKRYRLPTEAEWEYAARAGTETAYWWGDDFLKDMANCKGFSGDSDEKTASVGSFKANPFGLYDTAGNVWEWVDDCWHEDYNGAPADGSAWREEDGGNRGARVIRGGSWVSFPEGLRSSVRNWYSIGLQNFDIGFRLGQDLD